MWINVLVPDIKKTYEKAIQAGCTEVQRVTEMADYGVSLATFNDLYGYHWMLHQVHKEVSHEERIRFWEEKREN